MPNITWLLAAAAHHDHDGRWDGPGWWPIFPLVWIAIAATVIVIVRRRRGACWPRGGGEGVLSERFARGEIDEAEFRARRKVLRSKP